jgi:MFS family permease
VDQVRTNGVTESEHRIEGNLASIFDKDRIVAGPGFNRWLVPPAALAIHLSIGMAYGFSVFWLPLSRAVGIQQPIPCPDEFGLFERIVTTSHDWSVSMLGWMYTLFFVFLGGSAAVLGRWVERAGPRKAGLAAACCWGGGLCLSALGVYVHQIWLLWLGAGVIGGVGLGLGYISPVSTLLKWFPDRRGMATGLAIMGFGGGAMVGAPLADRLMNAFATEISVGVWQTFLVLGILYFIAMTLGALGYRLPPPGWRPAPRGSTTIGTPVIEVTRFVPVTRAWRTTQFWLAWGVLCLNVSAGIGILGMASPMIQEVFGGRLIGVTASFEELTRAQKERLATVAAAFAGLLSLFNILGRFAWASFSDYLGRKATYAVFFLLGAVLYAVIPWTGQTGSLALFVTICCVILTMYGGGFATIPAYLADLFGPQQISAIHGRLLTAWSAAGILGPVVVNYLRDWQRQRGLPVAQAYDLTMYVLAAMLLAGFLCNLMIRPVCGEQFESATPTAQTTPSVDAVPASARSGPAQRWLAAAAWTAVGLPLAWGVVNTFASVRALFE